MAETLEQRIERLERIIYGHARAQVDALCERLVDKMRMADRIRPAGMMARQMSAGFRGEATGLRVALCLLLGYDPATEAGPDGAAHRYVMDWWQRNHGDEPWDLNDAREAGWG